MGFYDNADYDSLDRSGQKQMRDERAQRLKIGDWVRFNSTLVDFKHNLAVIVDWDDDGFNERRAPRNKLVVVHVDPHLHEEPVAFRGRLQDFVQISEMEVIAAAAHGSSCKEAL
jgi:hypothetical protein